MSHESSGMIHSPNGRALNGRAHIHQGDADRFFCCPWNRPRRILATRPKPVFPLSQFFSANQ